MKKIKEGDIVARKSYDKDILFSVKKIIKNRKEDIAILTGVIERIEADSPINDLEEIDKRTISKNIKEENKKIEKRILWMNYAVMKKLKDTMDQMKT